MKSVLIAYVPALHDGYLKLFKKYPDTLFLLGEDFFSEYTSISRDVRKVSPATLKIAIESLNIIKRVEIIDRKNMKPLLKEAERIIMPNDDVSRDLAAKYFNNKKIKFEPIFLRWDKLISTTELTVPPHRVISKKGFDRQMIGRAFKEAEKSPDWWRRIGAFIVKNGKVLSSNHNEHFPTERSTDIDGDPRSNFDAGIRIDLVNSLHAEAGAIAIAAKKGIKLDGASIYVTTFPCPGCARLIIRSGIKKIYYSKGYSILDSEAILKAFGVDIILVK